MAPAVAFSILISATACHREEDPESIAVERGTWATIHSEIVVTSCAFASCHGGAQPAARLDLSLPSACRDLLGRPSCLFPGKALITPGEPASSFFMAKLTGEDLAQNPEVVCGTPTNRRMPFGAPALMPRQLAMVSSWIAAGADCGDGGGVDGGVIVDGGNDAVGDGGAADVGPSIAVASVLPARQSLVAGARGMLSIALAAPAGPSGVVVAIDVSDGSIVGAPATVIVPARESTIAVAIAAKRPGVVRIAARIDGAQSGSALGVDLIVTGLQLTEVFPAGLVGAAWLELGNVSDAMISLADYRVGVGSGGFAAATVALGETILAPGGCFVLGGPTSDPTNGSPRYDQVWDFSVAVMGAGRNPQTPIAVGLFDAVTDLTAAQPLPIDAVAFGGVGQTGLVGPDGQPLPSVGAAPPPGRSLARTSAGLWGQPVALTPGVCRAAAP